MKEIIILCPWNAQTGGPEALHQLSDRLIKLGFNVDYDRRIFTTN